MFGMSKALILLAGLGFLLAVFVALFQPIFGIAAESFSRASSNLALIAIAISVCHRRNAGAG